MQSLLTFFALTYVVSWTCFFTAVALSDRAGSVVSTLAALRMPLLMLGTFAPALVALGITAREACWHLPLFFVPGLGNYGQSFPLFVAGGIALSVAMAWLYANTAGSVLLAMLMHSAVNQTMGIVPTRLAKPGNPFALDTSPVAWLFGAILWMTAAYFLVRMRHVTATEGVRSCAPPEGVKATEP